MPHPAEIVFDRGTADGITFDDINTSAAELRDTLMARGLVFCTELPYGNSRFAGTVIARDWEHAEEVCEGRGLGERVIGQLAQQIIPKG